MNLMTQISSDSSIDRWSQQAIVCFSKATRRSSLAVFNAPEMHNNDLLLFSHRYEP